MSEPKNANITGEPLDLDDLLDFANVDASDLESASEWWDLNASLEWVGALDNEPVTDDNA